MDDNMKIVEFNKYCYICKYKDKDESEEPCAECLSISARLNSYKPEKFKEEKKK